MKFVILFLLSFLMINTGFSQDRKLRVYLDTKQFYAPTLGHLLEVNLQFAGASLNYRGKDNGLVADVAVYLTLEKGGVVYKEDAHRLESPFMKDSVIEDFYDLKRFVVEPGDYKLKIELKDLLSDNAPVLGSMPITVSSIDEKIALSDIQIAEVANPGNETSLFFKSGYEIIPRISKYYPEELNTLPYYVEVYNTNLLNIPEFGVKQSIIDKETDLEVADMTFYHRFKSSPVVPILKKIDISSLGTGNYYLQLSILDKDLTEVYKTAYSFDRVNEIEIEFDEETTVLDPAFAESISLDSAKFYLGSLIPISTPGATRKILATLKEGTAEQASLLLQSYWTSTAGSQAYVKWISYKGQVQLVDRIYATSFLDGYETDRGRVYLQYGSPTNIIQREVSAGEYPYEIWQFNKIGRFSNKRFIFYNTDLIGKNYRLLHSDMIGELKNSNWPRALNARNSTNGNVDNGNGGVQEHYGGQSEELFRQY